MSLEKITEHIEKETDTKVKKLIMEAQLKANNSIKQANEEAEKIRIESKKRLEEEIDERERVEKAKTSVESESIVKKAVSDAFKESMKNLYDGEKDFSKEKEYEKVIQTLIKTAKDKLGPDAVIYMNSEDSEKFGKKEKNVKTSRKHIFGVYAESGDGRLSVDLTLSRIIQNAEESIAQEVLKKITG